MASSINLSAYSDALVVLGTAGVVVPLVHRLGLNPVLGYLGAGALLGPLGLGSFIAQVPFLYWVTITDAKNVSGIADLGVVFLLFLIGLEMSYERLLALRRLVFGLGGLQVILTTAVIAAVLVGEYKISVAVIAGACLALSSTAIVLEIMSSHGRLAGGTGRASLAVLLAQDLAVIPLLMFISVLGADRNGSLLSTIGMALLQAGVAVGVIILVGRFLLRPLFRLVARTHSSELFVAAILFVIVATGVVAAAANVSMALGAFVAGLMLAETEYRKAIETTIEPFKGLLLGIFFFTVGMNIDARELAREPVLVLGGVAGLIALKSTLLLALGRAFHLSWAAAEETALLLGPGGEFAFVGLGLAHALGVMPASFASRLMAITALSMAMIPLTGALGRTIAVRLRKPRPMDPALAAAPERMERHAIVVGYGRVGRVICTMLQRHNLAYTAIDNDAYAVTEDRIAGLPVYFGDAANPAFLKACGLMEASGVIITVHTPAMAMDVLREVRHLRPDIPVIARARDAEHARALYALGVTDAVPETIEASLQLSEAALVGLGVPIGRVIPSIHEQRDEFRRTLQAAAQDAGRSVSHGVRAKSIAP